MARKRKPRVRWPDLKTPPETWSYAEARGVGINPIVTGIGSHPRLTSDEDWVLRCERDVEENGLEQFLADLLHILRLTIPRYLCPPPRVGGDPQRRSETSAPLPDGSYPGDLDWQEEGWHNAMVEGLLCNPVWAGIPLFPQLVADRIWIAAGVKMVEQAGLRQYLVNVLYQLKNSIRSIVSVS